MTYHNATSIPTHFGDTRVAQLGPRDFRYSPSPIEYRLTYINNLPHEVTIVWRSGLKFRLPPVPSMDNDRLIARVEITVHPAVKLDIERVLSAIDETATSELKAMREAFSVEIKGNKYEGARIILDYGLTLDELRKFGGTVYYSELDCVVSLLPFEQVPPHPYSEEGRQQQVVAGSVLSPELGFGYSVEIIDNAAKYGERYLNIGGTVYKVVPKKDYSRRNGIYVLSNQFDPEQLDADPMEVKFYDFANAEEIGLYRTFDEALHRGDIQTARKQEIATLEHEITMRKSELARERQKHEREMLALETKLKEQTTEAERRSQEFKELRERMEHDRELERQRTKDFYESRSYVRKDSSEAVKIIPSIVMGLGAVFMAIKAFF